MSQLKDEHRLSGRPAPPERPIEHPACTGGKVGGDPDHTYAAPGAQSTASRFCVSFFGSIARRAGLSATVRRAAAALSPAAVSAGVHYAASENASCRPRRARQRRADWSTFSRQSTTGPQRGATRAGRRVSGQSDRQPLLLRLCRRSFAIAGIRSSVGGPCWRETSAVL